MAREILISGEVRAVSEREKDGKVFMRQYKLEIDAGKDDVNHIIYCDYDLNRKYKVGDVIPASRVRPAISDFKGLHIEFHSINGNGNKPEEKKKPDVKI